MKTEKKNLCLFTMEYPYGEGENFIENEVFFLSNFFEKIFIIHKSKSNICRNIPKNVELVYINNPNKKDKILSILKNLYLLIKLITIELFQSRQKKAFRNNIKYNISHFINCIYYAEQIICKKNNLNIHDAYYYSYWFYDWNLSLSILRYKLLINNNHSRAHGFDLFEFNGKDNYLPLRKFCLTNTDKIFVISLTGKTYLDSIYPEFSNKTIVSYLGTNDYGINECINKQDIIHIVSCAHVNEVKRIDLIIEILKYCKRNIIWTHIGDGPILEKLKKDSNNIRNNIKINFLGKLEKEKVMNFYLTNHIDLFLNTSISEGIPVSIMEAISFGIPILATNVGGTKEIVNNTTGFLIDAEFKPENIAEIIDNWSVLIKNKNIDRKKIRKFWEDNFNSINNYKFLLSKFN